MLFRAAELDELNSVQHCIFSVASNRPFYLQEIGDDSGQVASLRVS